MIHFPHIEVTENTVTQTVEKTTYEVNGKTFHTREEAEAEAHVESVAVALDLYSVFLARRAADATRCGNVGVAKVLGLYHARVREMRDDEVLLAALAGLRDFLGHALGHAPAYNFRQVQDWVVRVLTSDDQATGIVRDQLAQFGVSKLSELQANHYRAFVVGLQDALAESGLSVTAPDTEKGAE